MMLVDVWPGGTLTDGRISAYKEADELKVIDIKEVVWYRNTNTAMFSYRTDMQEKAVHDILRNLTAKHESIALHERSGQ